MAVNRDKIHQWEEDTIASVNLYNDWFLNFAPATYQEERKKAIQHVEVMLKRTSSLQNLSWEALRDRPSLVFALRMSTAPPIARDRLIGLTGVSKAAEMDRLPQQ